MGEVFKSFCNLTELAMAPTGTQLFSNAQLFNPDVAYIPGPPIGRGFDLAHEVRGFIDRSTIVGSALVRYAIVRPYSNVLGDNEDYELYLGMQLTWKEGNPKYLSGIRSCFTAGTLSVQECANIEGLEVDYEAARARSGDSWLGNIALSGCEDDAFWSIASPHRQRYGENKIIRADYIGDHGHADLSAEAERTGDGTTILSLAHHRRVIKELGNTYPHVALVDVGASRRILPSHITQLAKFANLSLRSFTEER